MEVKFIVNGEPAGKGRPRFSARGKYVKAYTPEKTLNYENLIAWEYQHQCDYKFEKCAMLDMRIKAFYKIAKSTSKKKAELMKKGLLRPTKKPDIDNVVKIIADSLNDIAYHDDTQIVDLMCRKFYSDNPRVEVLIREINID